MKNNIYKYFDAILDHYHTKIPILSAVHLRNKRDVPQCYTNFIKDVNYSDLHIDTQSEFDTYFAQFIKKWLDEYENSNYTENKDLVIYLLNILHGIKVPLGPYCGICHKHYDKSVPMFKEGKGLECPICMNPQYRICPKCGRVVSELYLPGDLNLFIRYNDTQNIPPDEVEVQHYVNELRNTIEKYELREGVFNRYSYSIYDTTLDKKALNDPALRKYFSNTRKQKSILKHGYACQDCFKNTLTWNDTNINGIICLLSLGKGIDCTDKVPYESTIGIKKKILAEIRQTLQDTPELFNPYLIEYFISGRKGLAKKDREKILQNLADDITHYCSNMYSDSSIEDFNDNMIKEISVNRNNFTFLLILSKDQNKDNTQDIMQHIEEKIKMENRLSENISIVLDTLEVLPNVTDYTISIIGEVNEVPRD